MNLIKKQYYPSNIMSYVTANAVLDAAFAAVYAKRKKDSSHSDIWDLSLHWLAERGVIRHLLLAGNYRLSPVSVYRTPKGRVSRFSARGAVVLKAIALVLADHVKTAVGPHCNHLKGQGGLKGGVHRVAKALKQYRYIVKTDVVSFYESMDHSIVMQECGKAIKDQRILAIVAQYLNRVEVLDGEHTLIEQGVARGCPLSPLVSAIMLKSLTCLVRSYGFLNVYMDDWMVLTKTRHQLRRAVKKIHQLMERLKFKLALNKTYIGKISNGFDFLGFRFNHTGLVGLADRTIQNHHEKLLELYEQNAPDQRVGQYVEKWKIWVRSVWGAWRL
jgi:RNA-directed DNA polymerase